MTDSTPAAPRRGAIPPGCLGLAELTERMGWSSVQVARTMNYRAKKRREAGEATPMDMPPPDGHAGQSPYWREETVTAWHIERRRWAGDEDLPEGRKRCTKCREVKPTGDFYLTTERKGAKEYTRLMPRCKACASAAAQEWLEANPERRREADRRHAGRARTKRRRRARTYGLTMAQLDALEAAQAGRCLICGDQPDDGLVVDHCHTTGKVRGLLCHLCNVGLGAFRDQPRRMAAALAYLVNSHAA